MAGADSGDTGAHDGDPHAHTVAELPCPDAHPRARHARTLAYAEYGPTDGAPVLYFHGYPGSRLEPTIAAGRFADLRVRLIAVDRPGFGGSTFQPGRRIPDWTRDVAQLADHLGLDRFACMGVSGGGPYALACAHGIPERLTGVAVVCGVAPFDVPAATEGMMRTNRILFAVARRSQLGVRLLMWPSLRKLRRGDASALDLVLRQLPEPDRRALEDDEVKEGFLASTREALRQSLGPVGLEGQLYARPWGFRHQDIEKEVHVFQGELDRNVPPSMGRWQADALPHAKAHFYADEGHLSLVLNRLDDIVAAL